MKVSATVRELHEAMNSAPGPPVGFVPTMGALHRGHLSLVTRALDESPVIVVSIFVNPTQFNDRKDLEKYPRTPGDDLAMLQEILRPSDIVFMPGEREIYPEEDKRTFTFGNLDRVMEALHRPGHFNGVAQVVSRLFEIVRPAVAYFGQKDFQQLAVIKDLVRQTGSGVKIVACPIVRESDGLAMSSRNVLLEPAIRKNASVIFESLTAASSMMSGSDIPEIRRYVAGKINSLPGFELEYFEIADETELIPAASRSEFIGGRKYFCCIAVRAGSVRLIDNMEMRLD